MIYYFALEEYEDWYTFDLKVCVERRESFRESGVFDLTEYMNNG